MTLVTSMEEEERSRQARRITKNIHNRARSFERDEAQNSPMPLCRSHSVKREDIGCDQKWENQHQSHGSRQRRPWTKPGKLNNSYWEKRVQAEHSLPPRTPPPKRKLMGMMDGRITPLNRYSLIKNKNR